MAFVRAPVLPQREMTVEEFKAWLRRFDADRDGCLTREELQHALNSLNRWSAWWRARQGMKEADTNHNGRIDRDEMDKLIHYAQRHLRMKIYDDTYT
ncbi:hypothetical protein Taro_022312 [Colocasia esculenta]|uniref:EF-hand domain-containing protein n=1 Tax=Colocasia esculenta TaxID=4460 RepID=A0A843V1G5_COLES|nr:hypothetical protein [Colocasia esculenta]